MTKIVKNHISCRHIYQPHKTMQQNKINSHALTARPRSLDSAPDQMQLRNFETLEKFPQKKMTRAEHDDPQSRVLYELCAMIIQILRCPSPVTLPFPASYSPWPSPASLQSSPAAFGLLFFGISLALMMFGSVTFLMGFILMPWVVALVLIFYFAGIIFNLSHLGRSFLCWAMHHQDVPDHSLSHFQ